jgi:hypothetical protein
MKERWTLLIAAMAVAILTVTSISCSGGGMALVQGSSTGTVNLSLSDPPSCMPPNGHFTHVFVAVGSVQAHNSTSADDNSSGWEELAPQLVSAPMQINLFSQSQTTCVLARLGSASLPVGNFQ